MVDRVGLHGFDTVGSQILRRGSQQSLSDPLSPKVCSHCEAHMLTTGRSSTCGIVLLRCNQPIWLRGPNAHHPTGSSSAHAMTPGARPPSKNDRNLPGRSTPRKRLNSKDVTRFVKHQQAGASGRRGASSLATSSNRSTVAGVKVSGDVTSTLSLCPDPLGQLASPTLTGSAPSARATRPTPIPLVRYPSDEPYRAAPERGDGRSR